MSNAGDCSKVRQGLVHEFCPPISNDFGRRTEPTYMAKVHSPLMLPIPSVTERAQNSV